MIRKPPKKSAMAALFRELAAAFRQLKSEYHALNDRQSRHEDHLRESLLHIPPLERMAKTERNLDALLARMNRLEGRIDVMTETARIMKAQKKRRKGGVG